MKKILFLTNHLQKSDGVVRALINLTNNLDKDKYDITIVSLFRFENEIVKEFDRRIKVKKVFGYYFKGLSKLAKIIPFGILKNKIIGKENYDILVAYQAGFPTQFLSNPKIMNKKIVFMHGYDTQSIRFHQNYDKIVCVSKNASIDYKKITNFPEKITYCNNIISIDRVLNMSKENIDMNFDKLKQPIFGFVGRLSPEKGLLRNLEAVKRLKDEGYQFSFVLVGDGPEREKIKLFINDNKLNDDIVMVGFQSNPYKYMKHFDYYLCSSFSEGLNTSCIEASILNVPVISTLVSGAKEIFEDIPIGIVVDNSNEGIYAGMKKVLDNEDLKKEWQLNFNDANKKWTKEYILNSFDKIIEEVISK